MIITPKKEEKQTKKIQMAKQSRKERTIKFQKGSWSQRIY